eukprot:TRINITY_DN7505_c0_g1_i2.p1 TRINITY_DN7505_c0_g1~~TRINITY_DN7505_c0_g1_i2.p1  ORF type:complete len:309 (-),score=69.78 TRINITY_DN7505_c0_g1_i2:495-1421(-)
MCIRDSISHDGTVVFGCLPEGRFNPVTRTSDDSFTINELIRVWAEILGTSSAVSSSLLSSHQLGFMEFLYKQHSSLGQPKFNVVLAQRMEPYLSPETLLSRQGLVLDLGPMLGDIQHVYDLDSATILVVGTTGLLVSGPSAQEAEVGLLHYLSVMNISLFLSSFHSKALQCEDTLRNIRRTIEQGVQRLDMNAINMARMHLSQASTDFLKLKELKAMLNAGLESRTHQARMHLRGSKAHRIEEVLQCASLCETMCTRVGCMSNMIDSFTIELQLLRATLEGAAASAASAAMFAEIQQLRREAGKDREK